MTTPSYDYAKRPTILFGVTSGVSAKPFFHGLFLHLHLHGWDVHLTSTDEGDVTHFCLTEHARHHPIRAVRNPSLRTDVQSVFQLRRAVRDLSPALCVWGTPKLSFLGTFVCKTLGIPSIYVIHGLRYQGSVGYRRAILKALEILTIKMASEVVSVGTDILAQLLRDRVAQPGRVIVLGAGSANGAPDPIDHTKHNGGVRFGFVGRITRDKGLVELLTAWKHVQARVPGGVLLLFGRREQDAQGGILDQLLSETSRVREMGHIDDTHDIYRQIDVLVLPSYREGLPTVVLEAAANGLPSIVSDVPGAREPVVHGETGLHVQVGSVQEIAAAIIAMQNGDYRRTLGLRAKHYVQGRYNRKQVHQRWDEFFTHVLTRRARRARSLNATSAHSAHL